MSTPIHDEETQRQLDKAVATLRAQLALRGIHCYDCTTGGWLVCDHTMSRHCPNVESLDAFARQVGATR
ncbi:hypothetical protein H010_00590 [Hydrogenophaga taeniospiralis CCUG 15921]|uniref:Uncharacterized protein n=1 Tax=Hydrogenophaga taeniospiralis CCUG 15921 TaxID=1281780 RepID=A0A9X4NSX3_9BURK|nr:hypothetical protein [Hydrogenophaga taeniospiralis]MDG5973725.1 hypothetical protein [Hydrogenophaga taeniospiralis CCUG 15921]